MGTFSKKWMYYNCNAMHHCLGVKLLKPVSFRGQLTYHLYVTEIIDQSFLRELSQKPKGCPEDTNGQLQVKAFSENPSESQLIDIDMNNIETISTLK